VIGPEAEAEALYVRQLKLAQRVGAHAGEFVIWDVGLGAAANVLTALRATRHLPCSLRVLSFDHTTEPLAFALQHTAQLPYLEGYQEPLSHLLAEQQTVFSHGPQRVRWEMHPGDFPTLLQNLRHHQRPLDFAGPHAILFDAFSPAKNPAMWTASLFSDLFALLDPRHPCAMPTYSRSTMLRVTLLLAGFFVGVGHATGEKEQTTIAANSLDLIDEPLDHRWLLRARASKSAEPLFEPVYRQAPISLPTWRKLQEHPQFNL